MISELTVDGFTAVPHLETSKLIENVGKTIQFSTTKPNIVVGPNGAGKSALLTALAIRYLAHFTGKSMFDDHYLDDYEVKGAWHREYRWSEKWQWLRGLTCVTDEAPMLYYRPGHIPGNEADVTHAMMTGYSKEARAYGELTRNKSSGQCSQAVMSSMLAALQGAGLPTSYGKVNWRYGMSIVERDPYDRLTEYEAKSDVLKQRYLADIANNGAGVPIIMMDEPEQSLDARAEGHLWQCISEADTSKMQIIIATHSLYPLLHQDRFNLIEAEPGFIQDVLALMA